VLLATSHNVAKAYISRLHSAGLKPSKIILLNRINKRISINKKLLKVVRAYTFREIFEKVVSRIFNKKPSVNIDESQIVITQVLEEIQWKLSDIGIFSSNLNQSTKELLLDVEWHYDELSFRTINDPELVDYLKNNIKEKYIIYSGGGILRDEVLSINKKFIHVHPGVVPEVKGADCLLWSALVYNEIGMSSFFMNKGIDTGDIIKTKAYSVPKFNLIKSALNNSGRSRRPGLRVYPSLQLLSQCFRELWRFAQKSHL
jgi:hypothetical protein